MIITFQQIGVPGAESLAYKEAHAVVCSRRYSFMLDGGTLAMSGICQAKESSNPSIVAVNNIEDRNVILDRGLASL